MAGTILIIIAICSGFLGIFSIIYALVFGLTRHIFDKIKIYYLVIVGLIFGACSVLMDVLIKVMVPIKELEYFAIFMPILVYSLVLIFVGFFAGMGVLAMNSVAIGPLPAWLPKLFQAYENNYVLSIVIFSYIVITLLAVFKKYYKKVNNWWVWSVFSLSVLIVGMLFIFIDRFSIERVPRILVLSAWILTGYMSFAILTVIEAIYRHALKLRNIISYDQNNYILESGANEAITDFIVKNKVKYGLFINYYISNFEKFEKKLNNRVKDYIIQNIASQAYKDFQVYNPKTMFFKSSYKLFGAFVPLDELDFDKVQKSYENNQSDFRGDDDLLNGIQNTMKQIKTKFKIDNYYVAVKLLTSVSIYGLHSNDIEQLQSFNRFTETKQVRSKKVNDIVLIKPEEFYGQLNQNRKILALNEIIDLNQCATIFEPVFSQSENQIYGFYLNTSIGKTKITESGFRKSSASINESGLESLFNRYISFENLKSVKINRKQVRHKKIFLNYDQWIISREDFSIKELLKKISDLNINKHDLCFLFDISKEVSSIESLKENIRKLKKAGIETGLTNFGAKDTAYHLVGNYQPSYLFIEENVINKLGRIKEYHEVIIKCQQIAEKIDAKVILKGIDSYTIFKKVQKYENNLISGKLLGASVNPKPQLADETIFLLNKKD